MSMEPRNLCVSLVAAVGIVSAGAAFAANTTNKGANPNGKPFIELNGEIVEVEGEVSTLQDQVDALVGEVDSLEDRVFANEDAIASLAATSLDLQAQIDANADDIASLQQQVAVLEADSASLQAQINDLGDADGALQAQIDANATLITSLNQSLSNLSVTLQDQIDNNAILIAMLEGEIDRIDAELAEKQNLVDGICPDGSAVQQVLVTGDVICEAVASGGSGTLQVVRASQYASNSSSYRWVSGNANCPSGYLATSAGWHGHDLRIDNSYTSGNTAYVSGYGRYDFYVYATCARIAP